MLSLDPNKSPRLNGWPLFPLEEWPTSDLPRLVLPAGPLTLFTVYQPDTSTEEAIIWSFYREEEARIVLTNYRLADLEQASYLHWPDHLHHQPRLIAYLHAGDTQHDTWLALGHKPAGPKLPVTQGRGEGKMVHGLRSTADGLSVLDQSHDLCAKEMFACFTRRPQWIAEIIPTSDL
jgi:hypothetical protein